MPEPADGAGDGDGGDACWAGLFIAFAVPSTNASKPTSQIRTAWNGRRPRRVTVTAKQPSRGGRPAAYRAG